LEDIIPFLTKGEAPYAGASREGCSIEKRPLGLDGVVAAKDFDGLAIRCTGYLFPPRECRSKGGTVAGNAV
jgi:hypothetical protein